MKGNKYSSEWIAAHDSKKAESASGHLRKALECLKSILSNADDVAGAIAHVEKAIKGAEAYRPYAPAAASH